MLSFGGTLPETHVIFRDDGPAGYPTAAVRRNHRVPVFRVGRFHTEEFAVPHISKGPEAISVLRKHPLRYGVSYEGEGNYGMTLDSYLLGIILI